MTPKDLASKLDGATYPFDVPDELQREAKESGIVIVFGASDDLMEFRGAIEDEIGAYDGVVAYVTRDGLLENECHYDDCPHFEREKKTAAMIDAVWGENGFSWSYDTEIPHETFDVLEPDEDPYCRGIVFRLSDVLAPHPSDQ